MENSGKTTGTIFSQIFRWMAVCIVFFMAALGARAAIAIDGDFSDWDSSYMIGTDATGDVSPGDPVDWTATWAHAEGGNFFLSYQTAGAINFAVNAWRYHVFIDADNNPSTGFRGTDGSYAIGAEYMIEGATLYIHTGRDIDWSWVSLIAAPYLITGNRLEMSIPESTLGLSGRYFLHLLLQGGNAGTEDFANDDRSGMEYAPPPPVIGLFIVAE